jgi:hypothetical protein
MRKPVDLFGRLCDQANDNAQAPLEVKGGILLHMPSKGPAAGSVKLAHMPTTELMKQARARSKTQAAQIIAGRLPAAWPEIALNMLGSAAKVQRS